MSTLFLNLRTLYLASFQANSARASAVDSPSSGEVREASQKKGTVMDPNELLPEVTTSTNLAATEVIAQLRSHRIVEFADFLTANWPLGVTEECASEAVSTDCIELKLPEEMYCECCATYARICREWYARPDIQERMTA
jgi:hypothetical protein